MRVLIWGCGDYGHRILTQLINMNEIEIVGYTDSNSDMWGKRIAMFNIYSPDDIKNLGADQVLIAINNPIHSFSIKQKLAEMGFKLESIKDIFCDDFYFDLLVDQRIKFIEGYSKWIYSNNIEGAVAECGVFRGDSAKYINKYFPDRTLYLCDTFEGFDLGDLADEKSKNKGSFQSSRFADQTFFSKTSVDLVMSKMPNRKQVIIKKGYFPETMADIDEKFVFVNLDMDLYIPMLEGLKYFWNKMIKDGCILLHDYFSKDFERVNAAVNDFENEIGRELIKVPVGDDCSLAIVCR